MNSHATHIRNSQSHLNKRAFYYQLGGFIDVGLLSGNHHNIGLIVGEDLLLNEGAIPLF